MMPDFICPAAVSGKERTGTGRSPYQWQHEPCLFGWKVSGSISGNSDRKQTTIWEYDKPKSSKDHQTMKPVALMAYPSRIPV